MLDVKELPLLPSKSLSFRTLSSVVYKASSRSDLGAAFPCDLECVFSHLNKTNASVDVLEVGVRKKGQATVLVNLGVLDKPGRCWRSLTAGRCQVA